MKTLFLSATFLSAFVAIASAQTTDGMPSKDILAKEITQMSPVVPGMGEHWANAKDMPLGPIYCVHEGKIVCLEYMISQEELAAGKSWPTLVGMEGLPPVNHTSMLFEKNGHPGFEVPHYDIHLFFISPDEVKAIK